MKNFYFLTSLFLLGILEINAQSIVTIPDSNFEAALSEYDTDMVVGQVTIPDISLITSLDVSDRNITDLTGIEAFTNLTVLDCSQNNLSILDLSSNTALTQLFCSVNNLSVLDLSNNTALTHLSCLFNDLMTLELYNNTALVELNCAYNALSNLDLMNNGALEKLICSNNNLSNLNVKNGNNRNIHLFDAANNPSLNCVRVDDMAYSASNWLSVNPVDPAAIYFLYCDNPDLVYVPDDNFERALINLGLDDSQFPDNFVPLTDTLEALTALNLDSDRVGEITELTGIEAFIKLEDLQCQNNNLSTLNLEANVELLNLNCSNNNLSVLELSTNTRLEILNCSSNSLMDLDLSTHSALRDINCRHNNLQSLNLRNGNNSTIGSDEYNSTQNPSLTCVQVDDASYSSDNWRNINADTTVFRENCDLSTQIYIPDDNFESVLISLGLDRRLDDYVEKDNIDGVIELNLRAKGIEDLTGIEGFISLETLDCAVNSTLEMLDLSNNTALTSLDCSYTLINNLDLSKNTALINLICTFNTNLERLDLSNNTQLVALDCQNNSNLERLDLSRNTQLEVLDCRNNSNLENLNIRNGNNSNMSGENFNATNNTNLNCIQVDRILYSFFNWRNSKDPGTRFRRNCNYPTADEIALETALIRVNEGIATPNDYNLISENMGDMDLGLNSEGIQEVLENMQIFNFEIYPNPVTDLLNIETSYPIDHIHIKNTQGFTVLTSTQTTLDLSQLPTGIYIIHVQSGNQMTYKTLIKK